jgi:hypothetical protein
MGERFEPKKLWVNVYDVVQRYGGPEEGGWFYNEGIPEWSVTGLCHCPWEIGDDEYHLHEDEIAHSDHCPIHHLIIEAKAWVAGFKPGYLETFINGDPDEPEYRGEAVHRDKSIQIEEQTGRAYPEYRPHYE